jgi:putative DNA primase/helicase
VFVVERCGSKDTKKIKQKRPDPDRPGKWKWDVHGVRVVPYRLPEIIEAIASGHPVFVPEGEPKVELLRSWNLAATCNAGGAGKWKPEHAEFLRGADVILLPDHDDAGWKHIHQVGESLIGIAKRTRVLVLPHAKAKDDIIDWAKAGGTREQMDALLEHATEWQPIFVDQQREEAKARAKALEDELLDALAKAEGLDYARQRKEVANELGVTPTDIDNEVRRRREDMVAAPLYGHWITPPWPEVCDGDSLLRDIIKRIKRHVVITDDAALASALFLPMAWVHNDIAIHSPILNINSAEPESGKSTLIGLLSFLMPRCIVSVEASEAAIYRAIKRWQPSFAIDEFDTVLADDSKSGLRSVINSGHTRGQGVLRCVGDDQTPELFQTFAPKIIGMVGRRLPPATLSRCIFIELRRCKKDEEVDEFKQVDDSELADLRSRLCRWSMDNQDLLRDAKPSMPDELYNRRANNWKLQLAIADLCSGVDEWGNKARAAALNIEGKSDNRTGGVLLLADIKALFDAADVPCLHSASIVKTLVEDPEKPWAEYFKGKPLTQSRLGRMLSRYKITPKNVTAPVTLDSGATEPKQAKGYEKQGFAEAWSIYLS